MRILSLLLIFVAGSLTTVAQKVPTGFTSLFDGKSFDNWKVPEGDNGHWKIVNGVIDYDAESEADDKNLWSDKEYGDFVLYVDWRIKEVPWKNPNVPFILPSGLHKRNAKGEEIKMIVPDSDSGILLRGDKSNCQANIWNWPIGSGEVYSYRMNKDMPAAVRRAVTPKTNADNDIGEWNTFKITMKGNRMTVELNGLVVIENAELPGLPERGRIGLQHHGSKRNGEWVSPPSLVQFRNIYIKEI